MGASQCSDSFNSDTFTPTILTPTFSISTGLTLTFLFWQVLLLTSRVILCRSKKRRSDGSSPNKWRKLISTYETRKINRIAYFIVLCVSIRHTQNKCRGLPTNVATYEIHKINGIANRLIREPRHMQLRNPQNKWYILLICQFWSNENLLAFKLLEGNFDFHFIW